MTPDWTLHLGDCLAGLRDLADNSVDVTITDPPYDEHTHSKGRRGQAAYDEHRRAANPRVSRKSEISRNRDLGFDAITAEQMAAASVQLARITRRWSLLFCALEMISDWRRHLESAGLQYVRTCVWHKLGSTPQFTGDRPAVAVEAIVVAHRPGRKRWNGGGKHGYYPHAIVLDRNGLESRCHMTQKPLPLMLDLVTDFSEPGEIVLDPFAGSGTTGVACRQLRRRFVGWELNADYHAIAERRLRGEAARIHETQTTLALETR
jgi:site-specific DNA-methyltransferase (adenine-specific)